MGTEVTPMMLAFGAFAMAVLGASSVCWSLAIAKLFFRQPLIVWNSRRPVPWAFFDLVAILVFYIVATFAVGQLLRQAGWLADDGDIENLTLSQRQALAAGSMAVSLLVLAASLPLMAMRTGASWRDLGIALADLGRDLRLGAIGFVMLVPPVYALQGLLVYFWQPSKHPLMEMFKGTPDVGFFMSLVAAAVVVAPIFEELIFRVVLQGFLEKFATFRGTFYELVFGTSRGAVPVEAVVGHGGAAIPAEVLGEVAPAALPLPPSFPPSSNPYAAPQSAWSPPLPATVLPDPVDEQPELRGLRAWLPIAVSATVFALLHYSHGPDWVPLIVLAAGMGYLYQRTHRLLPSLIVHMLLNGTSMWMLWIQVFEGEGLPKP